MTKEKKQINFELCNEKRLSFLPEDFNVKNCKGHFMIHPSTARIGDINDWFIQITKLSDWKQDLLCAWGGHKIAMIDYDYWPDKEDIKHFEEILIRFWMVSKCGIRALYSSDGDGAIYYDKKYWKEALLLHSFHEGMFDLPNIRGGFNMFQGILLGYSINSIFEYDNNTYDMFEKYLLDHNNILRESLYEIDEEGFEFLSIERLTKIINNLWEKSNDTMKIELYKNIYEMVYSTYPEFEKKFKIMKNFVSTSIKTIENSEHANELKAFAYGYTNVDHTFSFGRKKQTKRSIRKQKKRSIRKRK